MYIGGRMEGHISDHNSGIQMQVLDEAGVWVMV